jgi:hypothetical protein
MPVPTQTELEAAATAAESALTDTQETAVVDTVTEATASTEATESDERTMSDSDDIAYPWPVGLRLNIISHNISGDKLFLTHQSLASGKQFTLYHGPKKKTKGNCGLMFPANTNSNSLAPVPEDFE